MKENRYPDRLEEIIDDRTKEFEKIFLSLRTKQGLNITEFDQYFKCSFLNKYKNEVDKLLQGDLARIDNSNIYLTSEGLYICDEIISNFAHL